uniref:Uncharacterized protein n=1 Tax=Phlebotomus papatasi TaxID=29031 RepID=A0A1B0D4P5_PHLPP
MYPWKCMVWECAWVAVVVGPSDYGILVCVYRVASELSPNHDDHRAAVHFFLLLCTQAPDVSSGDLKPIFHSSLFSPDPTFLMCLYCALTVHLISRQKKREPE